jgi:hypothetical protein
MGFFGLDVDVGLVVDGRWPFKLVRGGRSGWADAQWGVVHGCVEVVVAGFVARVGLGKLTR